MNHYNWAIKIIIIWLSCANIVFSAKTKSTISKHNYQFNDWQQKSQQYNLCKGHYQEKKPKLNNHTEISAEKVSYKKNKQILLQNNVFYQDDNVNIYTEKAQVDYDDKLQRFNNLYLHNKVDIIISPLRIIADYGSHNVKKHYTLLHNIQYRYYDKESRGTAHKVEIIQQPKGKKITLQQATYTNCPPNDHAWYLSSKKLILDQQLGQGKAWQNTLYFYRKPILYLPYFRFPLKNKRQSGFLIPHYHYNSQNGSSLNIPYYLNLASHYDMTLFPQIIQKHGLNIAASWRYLSIHNKANIFAAIDPIDYGFNNFRKNNLNNNSLSSDDIRFLALKRAHNARYAFSILDQYQKNNFFINLDYNAVSDAEYFKNFAPFLIVSATNKQIYNLRTNDTLEYLPQIAQLKYSGKFGYASIIVQHYQTLHSFFNPLIDEPFILLPQIEINLHNYDWNNFHTELFTQLTNFKSPSFRYNEKNDGIRLANIFKFSYNINKLYGYIKPEFQLKNIHFISRNDIHDANHFFPIFSLDSKLFLDRFIWHKNYIQTLEPRLFYLFVPYRNQNNLPIFDTNLEPFSFYQLFSTNRFSGLDRQINANQISYGITSRLLTQDSSLEKLYFSIGQIYFFHKQRVSLCNTDNNFNCILQEDKNYNYRLSPLIMQFNYNLQKNWQINGEWIWSFRTQSSDELALNINYKRENNGLNYVFNVTSSYLKQEDAFLNIDDKFNIHNNDHSLWQVYTTLNWPISRKIQLINANILDLRQHYISNTILGINYKSCCWQLELGYQRKLRLRPSSNANKRYDNIVYLQFSLLGLGKIGHSSRFLNNKIFDSYSI